MIFPVIQFAFPASTGLNIEEEFDVGDIEYLSEQNKQGNLTVGDGTLSATGDLVKITAGSGDMYLATASVNASIELATAFSRTGVIILEAGADGSETEIGRWRVEFKNATGGGQTESSYEFRMSGFKVTTGQVIQLRVLTDDTEISFNGTLQCIEVATGATPRLAAQSVGTVNVTGGIGGDLAFLANKEFDGKIFKEISGEFTNNAVQITHIVPSGKTFYLAEVRLYPVVNTVVAAINGAAGTSAVNRRADVEVKFDGTIIDVLTHDQETGQDDANHQGAAGGSGNYWGAMKGLSLDGDGVKVVELTSTNTSGTYRVSIIGFEETTADDPRN